MKKLTAVVLALTLLLALFTACSGNDPAPSGQDGSHTESSETEPSEQSEQQETVIVSLVIDSTAITSELGPILEKIPGYGTEFLVDTTLLPRDGMERDAAATRIRTEMVAGKGPDFFLCDCPTLGQWDMGSEKVSSLFPYPRQLMENRTFLPLDDYIENAEYMEWDKLDPKIMEAGQGGEGQMLLPLSFEFFAKLFDPADYTLDGPVTCWDAMASDDPVLRLATGNLADMLGEPADYEKDEPSFTEEELLELVKARLDPVKWGQDGGYDQLPDYQMIQFDSAFLRGSGPVPILDESAPEYVMVPDYNRYGGISAHICAYAAINRNAEHPDEAFRVLDKLLDRDTQLNSSLYACLMGMPVYLGAGNEDNPLKTENSTWTMSAANFQTYQGLLDQINAVRFPTPVDYALVEIMQESTEPGFDLEKSVHAKYTTIQMMLAES